MPNCVNDGHPIQLCERRDLGGMVWEWNGMLERRGKQPTECSASCLRVVLRMI